MAVKKKKKSPKKSISKNIFSNENDLFDFPFFKKIGDYLSEKQIRDYFSHLIPDAGDKGDKKQIGGERDNEQSEYIKTIRLNLYFQNKVKVSVFKENFPICFTSSKDKVNEPAGDYINNFINSFFLEIKREYVLPSSLSFSAFNEELSKEVPLSFAVSNLQVAKTLDYLAGLFYIQDKTSIIIEKYFFDDNGEFQGKGDKILDIASSPGGKALYCSYSHPAGIIIANEVIKSRIAPIFWNCIRENRINMVIMNQNPNFFSFNLPGYFDSVIADIPCSGESLMTRKNGMLSTWSQSNVNFCAQRGVSILDNIDIALKNQGYLYYSTCTFSHEENEDQIIYMQKKGYSTVKPTVKYWPGKRTGNGGFAGVLRKNNFREPSNEGDKCFLPVRKNDDFKLRKILKKNPIIDLIQIEGYLYLFKNAIHLFNLEEIPEVIFDNCDNLGVPLFKLIQNKNSGYKAQKKQPLKNNQNPFPYQKPGSDIDFFSSLHLEPFHNAGRYFDQNFRLYLSYDAAIKFSRGYDFRILDGIKKQINRENHTIKGWDELSPGYFACYYGIYYLGLAKKVGDVLKNKIPLPLVIRA